LSQSRGIGKVLAPAAALAAVAAVAFVLLGSGAADYTVHARFENAGQLVKGDLVQVAGVRVGEVTDIDLTDDGQASLTLKIDDDTYAPLRQGTLATVRQASLSGVANRYVDLRLSTGAAKSEIDDGGTIASADTTSAVDLDQLFNTFDPASRQALRGVIRGFAGSYAGRSAQANAGWRYLNPSLAATSRLFREVNRDTPLLRRFIDASSQLVTDVAGRRRDLSGLVDDLATTTGAIGRQKRALASSIDQLPDFMRNANTTFVNLRATLDDVDPLVRESKPVAKLLRPFLAALRPLTRDAAPTVRDLAGIVRRPGAANDLVELTRLTVPLAGIATKQAQHAGAKRDGAFPETVKALDQATPELRFARPYAVDLTGWFDDFSHSGMYDALGGASRAAPYVNAFTNANGVLKPILDPVVGNAAFAAVASLGQRNRCPGSVERGSLWDPAPGTCDPTQIPVGP
jgi:phospholipid/cholesterol/gamma-HCH transport system substrate-binding protein